MIDEKKLMEAFEENNLYLPEAVKKLINSQTKISEWISADKPPKGYNYILLSFANFSVPLVGRYEEDETGGAYYVGDDTRNCISQDIIVNAWMPLPEPYKEV